MKVRECLGSVYVKVGKIYTFKNVTSSLVSPQEKGPLECEKCCFALIL